MVVVMLGLKRLHFSMRRSGTERARFMIRHRHITFDCLFLTDLEPYEFVLAAVGYPGAVFVFKVWKGYRIKDESMDVARTPLAGLLSRGAESGSALVMDQFLRQIDSAVPSEVSSTVKFTASDVVRIYGHHHIEESLKIYFRGWLRNPQGKHVTAANLAKTRRCFGQQVHDACARQNISSCWSHVPADEVTFHLPPTPVEPEES